jgi:peptidoglycan/xylan/chitin deacetylase (PgdA/CDA1 family)
MSAGDPVKRAVGRLATGPLLGRRTRHALAARTAIVYVHYVGAPTPHYSAFYHGFTPERLDAQLSGLKRWFHFAPLADVLAFNRGDIDPPRPLLAVTFDDGFDMTRNGVLDILAAHEVSATTFVLTSTLDNTNLMWRNKLCAIRSLCPPERYMRKYNYLMFKNGQPGISDAAGFLPASLHWPMDRKDELADELWAACDMPPLDEYLEEHHPYFSWEGIQEWLSRGHAVGFHTHTHPICSRLSNELVHKEIIEPVRSLKTQLGVTSLPFSYPFGPRLGSLTERAVYQECSFDCLLGSGGFSLRGTPPDRLERASFEQDLAFPVFGKAFLGRPMAARTADDDGI